MSAFKRYGPIVAAIGMVVLLSVRNLVSDGDFTLEDRYVMAIAVVNAILTYVVPNLKGSIASIGKLVVNAALVGLAFYLKAQTGDGQISMAEWMDGIILVAGALGVAITTGPVWTARELTTGRASTTDLPPARR